MDEATAKSEAKQYKRYIVVVGRTVQIYRASALVRLLHTSYMDEWRGARGAYCRSGDGRLDYNVCTCRTQARRTLVTSGSAGSGAAPHYWYSTEYRNIFVTK